MAAAALRAELGRRRGVHLAHRVVELADAGEAGSEGDVGEGQVAGLDQGARGLCAAGAGQRQRAGAVLLGDHAVELAGRVAEALGQPVDAVTLDHAVGHQSHRPRGHVGRDVPLRGAGGRVGQAAAAGAVAGPLGRRGRAEEGDVGALRGDRRARGPAVDPGGAHRGVEDPVEATVAALDRPVAGLGVEAGAVARSVVMTPVWPLPPTASSGNRTHAATVPRSPAVEVPGRDPADAPDPRLWPDGLGTSTGEEAETVLAGRTAWYPRRDSNPRYRLERAAC